jgi:hypothetical protein
MGRSSSIAFSRRACLIGSGAAVAALLTKPLLAQDVRMGDLLQSMSSLTGTKLEDRWIEPTATLVSVILEDSKLLRSLELGAIEPATHFTCG